MAEYVERTEALEITTRTCGDYAAAWSEIRKLPAADVASVVHGRWIPIPEYENKRCSVCRTVFSEFTLGHYCPHCGARMDGAE
nr:MAG TPA: zinc-ribbon protein [Caudoviricetes sp.]